MIPDYSKNPDNDLANLHVRIIGTEDINAICSALRGVFRAVGNSDGHQKTNKQFQRGVAISFGSGPISSVFLDTVDRVIRKRVRNRLVLRRY